jgi:hypothetical protein
MEKIISIVMLPLLIVLSGCSPELYTKYELKEPVQEMDQGMLLAQLGKPSWVIDTTQFGGPRTYSYLYASLGGCVSSYTINAATRQVSSYRCFE